MEGRPPPGDIVERPSLEGAGLYVGLGLEGAGAAERRGGVPEGVVTTPLRGGV